MAAKQSAGILAYKKTKNGIMVFLAHPGGPFWAKKDRGAWSIPKGEFQDDEEALAAARREFREEIGQDIEGNFKRLSPCRQPSRKLIHAWAVEAEIDESRVRSNEFELEWPPRSGQKRRFPEIDRAAWFTAAEAMVRIHPGQVPILEELLASLGDATPPASHRAKPARRSRGRRRLD